MELTIEHLAPYLPYELQMSNQEVYNGKPFELTGIKKNSIILYGDWSGDTHNTYGDSEYTIDAWKPLLRPLSQLTQEITHNGETFVPMLKLFELYESNAFSGGNEHIRPAPANYEIISCKSIDYKDKMYGIDHQVKYVVPTSNMGELIHTFAYCEGFEGFAIRDETRDKPLGVAFQYRIFEKLFEWKFDLFNLLEHNLAIELTTKE